ncbi:hypothetical protein C1J02_06915 [Sulfitobacter sp. SK011]|nr:hypothetical protein C1J02_06915 [Sulfitobacter sp. SK011]
MDKNTDFKGFLSINLLLIRLLFPVRTRSYPIKANFINAWEKRALWGKKSHLLNFGLRVAA